MAQKALDLAVAGPRAEEIAEAEARLAAAQHALELVIAGPRAEEIAEAEAQLQSREAQLALLEQQLADAELKAPSTAIVRTRLMEPGEMASPQRPAFSLAPLTGWTAATGTATRTGFDTATATLVQVAEALKAVIDDLLARGVFRP